MVIMDILSLVEDGKYEKLVEKLEEGRTEEGETRINLNQRSKAGYSPLDMAALLGRKSSLELLLENGADVNSANKSGKVTARKFAVSLARKNTISEVCFPQQKIHFPKKSSSFLAQLTQSHT